MPEVRMSLADAATALGIAPNSVRSRFKAGKIRGERDNAGKIWVWLDPQQEGSKHLLSKPLSKPSMEGSKALEIEALQAHIQTLSEQLAAANVELVSLRPNAAEAVGLRATVAALEAQMVAVKEDRDQWRKTAQAMIERPSSGFFGLFRRARGI
jgi:hypothetical protein